MFRLFSPFAPFDALRVPNLADAPIPGPALALPLQGSLLPSSGTGTLTHTRATSAWMWRDADGRMWRDYAAGRVLIKCPAGELRFEGARRESDGTYYDTLSDGTSIPANEIKAVVELQATNLQIYSQDFTHTTWIKNGTVPPVVTANAAIAPDGTLTADEIDLTPASDCRIAAQDQLSTAQNANSTWVFSVYLKAKESAGFVALRGRKSNGTLVSVLAPVTTDVWSRHTLTVVSGSETTFTSLAWVGNRLVSGSTCHQFYAWGAQFEVVTGNSYQGPTTYIPTTTTTVTRNADQLVLSNYTLPASGALYFEAEARDWAQVGGQLFGDGTEYLLKPLTNQSGIQAFDGTNTANGPTGTPSGTMKFAVRWNSTTGKMKLAANGTLGTETSYDGNWNLASYILAGGFDGAIRNLRTYDSALTDSQMRRLTA